jgi:hypothetical protein
MGEPRISSRAFCARLWLEHRQERTLPALAKRGNPERSLQLLAGMSRQIQECINLSYRHPLRTIADFHDIIARANLPFPHNAKVESGSSVCHKQSRHARLVHADAHAIARHPRLCYFKYGIANSVSITDADLVIRKPFDREVFAELAETEIITHKKALPVLVRAHLIDKYRTLLPTMSGEIRLPIAIDIKLAHHPSSADRKLPDRRSDSLSTPCDIAWQTDIQ